MSSINIKEILGKLSLLKSNLSILVSIIIAMVAVLLFVPLRILSSNLEQTVKKDSLGKGAQIRSAKSQAVPKDQWKELAKYEAEYKEDANEIARLALESTQRELLSYDIFPSPNDTSSLIFKSFGEHYRTAISDLTNRVNAKDCPSDEELVQGMANANVSGSSLVGTGNLMYSPSMSVRRGESRFESSVVQSLMAASGVEATIRDEICLSRAKSISVYVNPVDLAGYDYWGEYKYDVKPEDAIQDCWYYQLAYWVIEDVFSTIGSMNAGSTQVFTSPVKRLMYVRFGEDLGAGNIVGVSTYGQARPSATAQLRANRPNYIDLEGMTGFATDPHTNRLGDEDIDVMHFSFAVIIETNSVLPFMKELCSAKKHEFKGFRNKLPAPEIFLHNQITVLKSGFYSIERSDKMHFLYRYGKNAAVELELICEYIFNKQAYDAIKPAEVKESQAPKKAGTK